MKKYKVSLNDNANTIVLTNSLTKIVNGEEVAKFPKSATWIINEVEVQPEVKNCPESPILRLTSNPVTINTYPLKKWNECLVLIDKMDRKLISECGFDYRRTSKNQ